MKEEGTTNRIDWTCRCGEKCSISFSGNLGVIQGECFSGPCSICRRRWIVTTDGNTLSVGFSYWRAIRFKLFVVKRKFVDLNIYDLRIKIGKNEFHFPFISPIKEVV